VVASSSSLLSCGQSGRRQAETPLSATVQIPRASSDLAIQDRYGVKFLTYWFDEARGTAFCLIQSPDKETADRVHREAHGDVAHAMVEVELSAVEAFLGRIGDPRPPAPGRPAEIDPGLRAVMFTDIVGSIER
jgi:hypothetical protein